VPFRLLNGTEARWVVGARWHGCSPRCGGVAWRRGPQVRQERGRAAWINCYSDYAVTNAQQFMDLLSSADVPVVPPQG
jgi:hypothetical protein